MKKIVFLVFAIMLLFVAGCGSDSGTVNVVSTAEAASSSEAVPSSVELQSAAESEASSSYEIPVVTEEENNNDWEFDVPENHGVDSALLDNFYNAIGDTNINSVVIAKNGVIIDEYYKDDYDENSVFSLRSCTKSFSGALIGIALEQGLLSSVDVKLSEFFPQLAEADYENKQEITVEHMLTHTSGIAWYEWAGGTMFMEFTRSDNWVDFVLSQPMATKPGDVFNYTTGGSHMLAAVLQQATGKTAAEFGQEYLFDPLGMDSVQWRTDPQGITDGGNGVSMTSRDAAKFGQLYLNGGKWGDKQIIPKEWVEMSVETQAAGSPGTGEYGYSWWLKSFGGYDAYYAMGHGGQYIFVVPELELVTVITSRSNDTYAPQYYFNDYIIAACK